MSAGTLVELPVTITPSLRKYSAALAVSAMLTSEVIVWALKDEIMSRVLEKTQTKKKNCFLRDFVKVRH